jgi:hypothetical protein
MICSCLRSPKEIGQANHRPAAPFNLGEQFVSVSCALPSLSAAIAHLWRCAKMRAFIQTRSVLMAVGILTCSASIRTKAGGVTGNTEAAAGRLQITLQIVDSEGSPIRAATVSEDIDGVHPKGYQSPRYVTDMGGYARLTCATNSAGISVRASGFFGAQVRTEGLSSDGTSTVRSRRSTVEGEQPAERDSVMPACRDLIAPAALSDADILSVIRLAVAAPGMRGLPRSVWFIRIEPETEEQGLTRLRSPSL